MWDKKGKRNIAFQGGRTTSVPLGIGRTNHLVIDSGVWFEDLSQQETAARVSSAIGNLRSAPRVCHTTGSRPQGPPFQAAGHADTQTLIPWWRGVGFTWPSGACRFAHPVLVPKLRLRVSGNSERISEPTDLPIVVAAAMVVSHEQLIHEDGREHLSLVVGKSAMPGPCVEFE
jgi:hypothetical protein